jgi:hypothetical protein
MTVVAVSTIGLQVPLSKGEPVDVRVLHKQPEPEVAPLS